MIRNPGHTENLWLRQVRKASPMKDDGNRGFHVGLGKKERKLVFIAVFLLLSYFGCSGVLDVPLVWVKIIRSCLGTWVRSGLGERCVLQGKGGRHRISGVWSHFSHS